MKKFLSTILVLIVAIVPLFSMVVMAYDYDNDVRFEFNWKALNVNNWLATSPKQNANYNFSKVKISKSSDDFNGHLWVEIKNGTMLCEKVECTNDGVYYNLPYKSGLTVVKGTNLYFYGEQGGLTTKYVIGRAYPY